MAKLFLVILVLALSVLGIMTLPSLNMTLPSLKKKQEPPQPNTLRWYVEKAKKEGKHKISMPPPMSDYAGADDPPDEILANADVVIAQPIDSHTGIVGDSSIVTWYKFKVIETLSEGIHCQRCPDRKPPDELLPVNEDEFILSRVSGTATIDGVEISVEHRKSPLYSKDKKYLLFLVKSPNGTPDLLVGPAAVFTVNPEGTLEPINDRPHRLKEVIKQRFNYSVEQLKQHVKKTKES